MASKPFGKFLSIPPRNGLTKPKKVRGQGFKMVNMGELFKYSRINNVPMDRVPLTSKEQASSLLEAGDLLFARQSLVREGAGKCSIFLGDSEPVCFESHLIRCRIDQKAHSPLFFYYYFSSPEGKALMDTIIEQGAGAAGIRGSDLVNLIIPEFTLGFQRKVASILDSLDRKIQLNHQINQTLEQMAQAIFKSWFVDFEPVKAKIAALEAGGSEEDALLAAMQAISAKDEIELARLQAEQPEQYAELRATAELFPSAMQESELGEIPEGWEASDFGSVSSCFDRHRIPLSKRQREQRQGSIPYYGATSIMDYVDEPIFDGVYLLLGEDGSVLKEDGSPFTQYIWGKSWVNNHAHVLQGANGVSTEQLYLFIGMQNITAYVTGAVQLKLNQKNMNSIPFIKAPDELNTRFAKLIAPMFGLRRTLTEENGSLTGTRDALLPRLLSGELSVSGAEDHLAEEAESANV